MYSTIAVVYLQSSQERIEEEVFSQLWERIRQLGYDLQTQRFVNWEDNLTQILQDNLMHFDLIIVIALSAPKIFNAALEVYDEHWENNAETFTHDNIGQVPSKQFQVIQEEKQQQVIWLHRFYFIAFENAGGEWNNFVDHLKDLKAPPFFSKLFEFQKDEKLQGHIEQLLTYNNGMKTCKRDQDEVVVSSRNIDEINRVHEYLDSKEILQSSSVIEMNCEIILNCNYHFIRNALSHIEECFKEYQPENVFISFNGGKDCTVLLHLTLLVLQKLYPKYKQRVFCMYVQSQKPFPEVLEFIEKMQRFYNLDMRILKCGIKEGLRMILDEKPQLRACLMGTRRTDPFSAHLRHFHATDNGFPDIIRVSPLLDWEFAHIWDYLIHFKVPYCPLYDVGYTSLGNVDDTAKNPQLRKPTTEEYYPAYKLLTSTNERSGRRK